MAKAPTEEQSQLKRRARRRLVGSIALVTVVAVILPWVLDDEPGPTDQPIAIEIPAPGASKFEPRQPPAKAAPVAPESPASSAGPPTPSAAGAPATHADDALHAEQAKVLSAPVKTPPTKAVPAQDAAAAKDKAAKEREKDRPAPVEAKKKPAEKSEVPAADAKPYVVQIAALADADKAADVQKSMSAKGLRVYTEKVKTANGEVTRVRVGPFPNRDAAEKERARMKALGFDGNVVPK